MKPFGHHNVAEQAGLPLLMEAYGADHRALGAFYLGNWIADFSQLVEPVAMASARNSFTAPELRKAVVESVWPDNHPIKQLLGLHSDAVTQVFKRIYTDDELERCEEPGVIPRAIFDLLMVPEHVSTLLDEQQKILRQIDEALDALFLGRDDTRDSGIGLMMRDVFYVIGYFQFVFESENTEEPDPFLLTMDEFEAVFGDPDQTTGTRRVAGRPLGGVPAPATPGAFTQYYPHEHYDRPTIPEFDNVHAPGKQEPGKPIRLGVTPGPDLDEEMPAGPRAVTSTDKVARAGNHRGAKGTKEPGAPDIYSFLRDFMEGTAGLLAELDDAFAAALAAPPVAAGRGGSYDPDWVRTLAKAGHALHQVEDYFAHSNFVELAVQQLGREDHFLRKEDKDAGAEAERRIFSRRLKRFVNGGDEDEPETWVVTGYFDTKDTAIAIIHTLQAHQEIWGTDNPYRTRETEGFEDPVVKVERYLKHPLKEPTKDAIRSMQEMYQVVVDHEKALADPDNKVAKVINKKFPQIKEEFEEGTRHYLTVQDIRGIAAVLPALEGANPRVVQAFANIYILNGNVGATREAGLSVLEALSVIGKMMFNPLGLLSDELKEMWGSNLRFAVQEGVLDLAGADRIGCHSLLAKDHLDAVLYNPMWHCAAAVHSHIIKVLVRDRRQDPEGEAVDWLELLEAMLRNPATPMDDGASRESRREEYDTITHVAKRGEQLDTLSQPALSLTRRYARNSKQGRYRAYNAKQPADGFHWRMIADATFGTHGQSDARARGVINRHLKSIGAPRVGANYALKPGMELKIPFQKKTTRVEEISRPTKPWWEALLEQDNPDFGTLATKRGEDGKMGHVPKFMPRAEFDAMIQRGRYLREVFREFYRPEEGAGGGLQVAMPRNSEWPRQAQFPNLARKHR